MVRQRAAFGILLALMVAAPLHGQQRSCRQVLPSDFRRLVDFRGQEILYFRDPVRVFCTGGVRLEADSAVLNRGNGSVELVGRVVYQDTVRRLEADWANYLGRMDQLLARGDARIEDIEGGAVITGEQLNYLRETETRPVARLIVTGNRPHARLPARDSARADPAPGVGEAVEGPPGRRPGMIEPDAAAPPDAGMTAPVGPEAAPAASDSAPDTHVWADRLEVEGEVFRADGNVEIERGELAGVGRRAQYDQEQERMTLSGDAHLASDAYELSGALVEADLAEDELRELRSTGDARALSESLEIRSQNIRIRFEDGEVRGLEAWNVEEDTNRIWASAEDFELRADSLDVIADSAGIRELRAIGRAFGERWADSTAARTSPPDSAEDVVRDWVQGDTILGFFAQTVVPDSTLSERERLEPDPERPGESLGPEPGPDSARTVLERIEVVGGPEPALSFYQMVENEGERASLNFMKAQRIVLFMEEGEVARVEAEGPIEGVYLEPRRVAPAEPEGGGGGDDPAA